MKITDFLSFKLNKSSFSGTIVKISDLFDIEAMNTQTRKNERRRFLTAQVFLIY